MYTASTFQFPISLISLTYSLNDNSFSLIYVSVSLSLSLSAPLISYCCMTVGPFTHPERHFAKYHRFFGLRFTILEKNIKIVDLLASSAHAPLVGALHALARKRGESREQRSVSYRSVPQHSNNL